MAGTRWPRAVRHDPYGFDADLWIGVPRSIDDRARAVAPQESSEFWSGLSDGKVHMQRCAVCARFTHYPTGGCQWCGGPVSFEEVDATARVNTWTLSTMPFGPGVETPYVAALVNPVIEPQLNVLTNLVECRVREIRIGMLVVPRIFHGADRSLLFFTPSPSTPATPAKDPTTDP